MTVDEHLKRGTIEDFHLIEGLLLTEQMGADREHHFRVLYPAFDTWLRERERQRRGRRH